MQHEIDAPLPGATIDRGGEGRIDGSDQSVLAPDCRNFLEVNDTQVRIRRRFDVQKLCVRTDRSLELLQVVGVDECRLDSQIRQPGRKKLDYAAVNVTLGHDVVARLYQRKKRSGDRGHA